MALHCDWPIFQQQQSKSQPNAENVDDDPGLNDELSDLYSRIESNVSDVTDSFLKWLRLQVQHRIAVERLLALDLPRPLSIDVVNWAM